MGIVSDSDFDLEKKKVIRPDSDRESVKPNAIPNATVIDMPGKGRGIGNVEVPNALRQIIGEESVLHGREAGIQLAGAFGISPSSVSAYDNGSTSTSSYDKQPNLNHLNGSRTRIAKRAMNKLGLALKNITRDKLEGAKVTELAAVAKDMSAIVKNMEPETAKGSDGVTRPQFVFYAPQFRDERVFDVVIAKDDR